MLTDASNEVLNWTVNNLTSTTLELASINVDITKSDNLTSNVYTPEEQTIGFTALLLMSTLDKQYGGTIDFDKEPDPKSVQVILKGKAQ